MNITLYTIGILLFLGINLIILIIKEKKLKNKKQKYAQPKYSDPKVLSKRSTKMLMWPLNPTVSRNNTTSIPNANTLHYVGSGANKVAVPKDIKKAWEASQRRLQKGHIKRQDGTNNDHDNDHNISFTIRRINRRRSE